MCVERGEKNMLRTRQRKRIEREEKGRDREKGEGQSLGEDNLKNPLNKSLVSKRCNEIFKLTNRKFRCHYQAEVILCVVYVWVCTCHGTACRAQRKICRR